jgi:acetate kinase
MSLILSLNAGSSSLKISLYHHHSAQKTLQPVLAASISSIQSPSTSFTLSVVGSPTIQEDNIEQISNHASAFAYFLNKVDEHANVTVDGPHIRYVCHRVVHGGDYKDPVKIDSESYVHIQQLSSLAPLHNGPALSVMKACFEQLPNSISIAYFDSCFHRNIPPHIYSYAINQEIATKRGLRKYGFHGLSYAYILRATSEFLGKTPEELNLIILHLGSGASACAVRNGTSFDTSMGLTPLSGLPGATRSGTVDPGLIFHYTNKAGRISYDPGMSVPIGVTEAEDILNRKAGWKAMTGTTDFKEIVENADLDHPPPMESSGDNKNNNPYTLAFYLFLDRILDLVGAYHLKLGANVDALVFSGGIGEHSPELREAIGKAVECLSYQHIDPEKNRAVQSQSGSVVDISFGERKGRVLVCRTDEQFEMARQCGFADHLW